MTKVESILDNVEGKVKSLDGIFNFIDLTTDKLSMMSDSIFNTIYNFVINIFSKIRNKEEVENE